MKGDYVLGRKRVIKGNVLLCPESANHRFDLKPKNRNTFHCVAVR